MNIIITGRSVKITSGIRDKIEKFMNKHKQLLEESTKIQVELKQAKSHGGVDKDLSVEVTIHMPKVIIRVEEDGDNFYSIIDEIDPILRRRLVRYRDHQGKWGERESWKNVEIKEFEKEIEDVEEDVYADEANFTPKITRYKEFSQNYPMEVGEAIERMELLGHEAFLFKNIENNKYSMVYHKKDGSYGLVEPKEA